MLFGQGWVCIHRGTHYEVWEYPSEGWINLVVRATGEVIEQ